MTERFTGRLADVIRRPLITEKATRALEKNQYTFEVDPRAAKPDIKAAIEQLFDVKVTGISTMNPPRRARESSSPRPPCSALSASRPADQRCIPLAE